MRQCVPTHALAGQEKLVIVGSCAKDVGLRQAPDGTMIEPERIQVLKRAALRPGNYVLYWMQQSQRARCNPALELALLKANELKQPLVVCFALKSDYPEANARHFTFMLQGLKQVENDLRQRGIAFLIRRGHPPEVALTLGRDASLVLVDRGYLRHLRQWREQVARDAECPVIQVEGDAVVPVQMASNRAELAARTLRPKLKAQFAEFLHKHAHERALKSTLYRNFTSDVDLSDVDRAVAKLALDDSVGPVRRFIGGTSEAYERLNRFLDEALNGYADKRNEPSLWHCSQLSPYLHFGQISPVDLARRIMTADAPKEDRDAFIEELVVRRELGLNFVTFERGYDRFSALPSWARTTLAEHAGDERANRYSRAELEAGETHDRYWNAAVREMVHTGYMHNYMRMYWAKKILEWSASPQTAYRTALYLMNKYFLDGRDPLSYSNVAWCFGQHDRPWPERPVFGTVRSMVQSGLTRKFDMERYVEAVEQLVDDESKVKRNSSE
jgi:deoxyribodipyrimidine photo-lyase